MVSFFPWWIVVTHFLNIFFMLLLARSGLEVLSALPKLYWNDDCTPGREWLRFSKKNFSADSRRPWSSLDEEESWSPVVALPGRKNLGLGRHWHFMSVQFWILTGTVYVALVIATGYWHYLIPTRWSIFPDAVRAVGSYLSGRSGYRIREASSSSTTWFAVVRCSSRSDGTRAHAASPISWHVSLARLGSTLLRFRRSGSRDTTGC